VSEDREFMHDIDGYSVTKLVDRRNKLCKALDTNPQVFEVLGEPLEYALPVVAPLIANRVKASVDVVSQSLMQLLFKVQEQPTRADYRRAIWIMLANEDMLQADVPLNEFTTVVEREWVPVSVANVRTGVHPTYQKWGFWMKYRCIGGRPTTHTFTSFHDSSKSKNFLYYTMFELQRNLELKDPKEFTYMQSWVLLDPAECTQKIVFERVGMTPSMRTWNRGLLRRRRDECVMGLDVLCQDCHVGACDCPNAVHDETYVQRHCSRCNTDNAWFEPGSHDTRCLRCREGARLAKERERLPKKG